MSHHVECNMNFPLIRLSYRWKNLLFSVFYICMIFILMMLTRKLYFTFYHIPSIGRISIRNSEEFFENVEEKNDQFSLIKTQLCLVISGVDHRFLTTKEMDLLYTRKGVKLVSINQTINQLLTLNNDDNRNQFYCNWILFAGNNYFIDVEILKKELIETDCVQKCVYLLEMPKNRNLNEALELDCSSVANFDQDTVFLMNFAALQSATAKSWNWKYVSKGDCTIQLFEENPSKILVSFNDRDELVLFANEKVEKDKIRLTQEIELIEREMEDLQPAADIWVDTTRWPMVTFDSFTSIHHRFDYPVWSFNLGNSSYLNEALLQKTPEPMATMIQNEVSEGLVVESHVSEDSYFGRRIQALYVNETTNELGEAFLAYPLLNPRVVSFRRVGTETDIIIVIYFVNLDKSLNTGEMINSFLETRSRKNKHLQLLIVYYFSGNSNETVKKFRISNNFVKQITTLFGSDGETSIPWMKIKEPLANQVFNTAMNELKKYIRPEQLVIILNEDYKITSKLLDSCRRMAERSRQIYFPIPFQKFSHEIIEVISKNRSLWSSAFADRGNWHYNIHILKHSHEVPLCAYMQDIHTENQEKKENKSQKGIQVIRAPEKSLIKLTSENVDCLQYTDSANFYRCLDYASSLTASHLQLAYLYKLKTEIP